MLTDQDAKQMGFVFGIGARVVRAIEAAVLQKLAQGVSVERLKNIDWQQFAMHGGEPCFDLDRDGSLCGRARHWFGHNAPGSFVSLHDFATTAIAAARVQALEEAAKVCDRQAIPNAGFLAEKVRALINTNLTTGEMK
jgi:hypothetical protein